MSLRLRMHGLESPLAKKVRFPASNLASLASLAAYASPRLALARDILLRSAVRARSIDRHAPRRTCSLPPVNPQDNGRLALNDYDPLADGDRGRQGGLIYGVPSATIRPTTHPWALLLLSCKCFCG